ncbi:MAG: NAD(P)-binding domain-containing protein [Oricola sp.]
MPVRSRHYTACIIGAGPCGLTTIRNFLKFGVEDFVCHEALDDVGGLWAYSEDPDRPSVYDSAHIISSRRMSWFRDYPMPRDYPDYPSRQQIHAYFGAYANEYDLRRHIRFNSRVDKAERMENGVWRLTIVDADGTHEETADNLIVASGHHRVPFTPGIEGDFAGRQLHSAEYRTPRGFEGERVLVVGAGNSACDIAAALSPVADHVSLSIRTPQYILPKMAFGRPTDVQYAKLQKFPRFVRDAMLRFGAKLNVGPYERYRLPQPKDGVLATHPTLNSDILERLVHGDVTTRRATVSASAKTVSFADGASDEFDTIIWATGYRTTFPFLSDELFGWSEKTRLPLFMKIFPPDIDNVFFIGLIQPLGCIWRLADAQAEIVAHAITGKWKKPSDIHQRISQEHAADSRRFRETVRHAVEVDYHDYARQMLREIAKVRPVTNRNKDKNEARIFLSPEPQFRADRRQKKRKARSRT